MTPWFPPDAQRLRDEVFITAMKVHRAFIDAAAKPLRHNLGALMSVLKGSGVYCRSICDARLGFSLPRSCRSRRTPRNPASCSLPPEALFRLLQLERVTALC